MIQSLYIFILVLFSALFTIPEQVAAAAVYSVSPLVIDTVVEGRDIITKDITVFNSGTEIVTVYPTVNNISIDNGGKIEKFIQQMESDRTQSLSSWIEIRRLGTDIRPGESFIFPVTLRIHPNPVSGTYHAFVGFPYGDNREDAEKKVDEGISPGTIISVTIEKKESQFLKLSKFIINRFIVSNNNEAAVFTLSNPGTEPVVPTGEIIVYSSTGKEVAATIINSDNKPIEPGQTHTFSAQIKTDGLFGKYKGVLTAEYGTQNRASLNDTSYFYILPIKKLLIISSILLVLIVAIALFVHKKYVEESIDDSERLVVHLRESVSDPKHHDIDLKKNDN